MKEPTKRQISFAEKIACRCNKELPKEFTSKAYWQFINDNITEFNIKAIDEDDLDALPDFGYFC